MSDRIEKADGVTHLLSEKKRIRFEARLKKKNTKTLRGTEHAPSVPNEIVVRGWVLIDGPRNLY